MTERPTHHGAFKTPGGKLVAVDFDVVDGALRNVQVHGDFFLHPEEALEAISSTLEGTPATASTGDIAKRIDEALPKDTEWLGSSPAALATAVERALAEQAPAAGGGERRWS
jgi:lipoate---protein ligase